MRPSEKKNAVKNKTKSQEPHSSKEFKKKKPMAADVIRTPHGTIEENIEEQSP